jgi:hypothetical protein
VSVRKYCFVTPEWYVAMILWLVQWRFKAQWEPDYPDAFRAAQTPTQLPVQKAMGHFSRGKVAGP